MKMTRYKIAALLGTILMGVSSFVACLANSSSLIMAGNIGLVISILIMVYGFNTWQP